MTLLDDNADLEWNVMHFFSFYRIYSHSEITYGSTSVVSGPSEVTDLQIKRQLSIYVKLVLEVEGWSTAN